MRKEKNKKCWSQWENELQVKKSIVVIICYWDLPNKSKRILLSSLFNRDNCWEKNSFQKSQELCYEVIFISVIWSFFILLSNDNSRNKYYIRHLRNIWKHMNGLNRLKKKCFCIKCKMQQKLLTETNHILIRIQYFLMNNPLWFGKMISINTKRLEEIAAISFRWICVYFKVQTMMWEQKEKLDFDW